MDFKNININELSNLAKLDPKDVKDHIPELVEILKFAETLNELDTLQIDPLVSITNMADPNSMRQDIASSSISTQEALFNAPKVKGSFFTAPKVLDK